MGTNQGALVATTSRSDGRASPTRTNKRSDITLEFQSILIENVVRGKLKARVILTSKAPSSALSNSRAAIAPDSPSRPKADPCRGAMGIAALAGWVWRHRKAMVAA
jgi:hypothetical protein